MEPSSPFLLVCQALRDASSQEPNIFQPASEKLTTWEKEPGFHNTLAVIIADRSIDEIVRWMASVYMKNAIDKFWRKNSKFEISPEEKASIRQILIVCFKEPVHNIAVQVSESISRIARIDYPKEWPTLIPSLMEALQVNDSLEQLRALVCLQSVIKALASKRLMSDRKTFEHLTENMYGFMFNMWDTFSKMYFQSIAENTNTTSSEDFITKAIYSLKIMRRLTIQGWHKPKKSEICMSFLKTIFNRTNESLECRMELKRRYPQGVPSSLGLHQLEKFIKTLMKILIEMLEMHPLSLIELLNSMLEFTFEYAFMNGVNMVMEDNKIVLPEFVIQCMTVLNGIVKCDTYSTEIEDTALKIVGIPEALAIKNSFFSPERLTYICDKLISYYFLLTEDDLNQWDADPEKFATETDKENWKFALRPCAETLFLTLFRYYRNDMTTEMIKFVKKAQLMSLNVNSDLNEILAKDAIYNAVGLSAFDLFDDVDFDSWFTNQLIPELGLLGPKCRIIRRRVIWLIGNWVTVKLSKELRPQVYAACVSLMDPSVDMAIRLAAAMTLKNTLDDFEFQSNLFLDYLEPCFSLLLLLLKEVEECETKMKVLSVISFAIEKMSDKVSTQANDLIAFLPILWEESSEFDMLRCAILSTIIQIMKVLYEIPANLTQFLYNLINISTNVNEKFHVYLIEDGLDLWLVVLENSREMTNELLELSNNLLPIIEQSSENLKRVLYIIHAYIYLDPTVFLQLQGNKIISVCMYLVSDMKPEGVATIMKLFDSIIKAKPDYAIELLKPVYPFVFGEVYKSEHFPTVMTTLLTIISRILLLDKRIFEEVIQSMNVEQPFEKIMEVWLYKMPLVTPSEPKKLLGLALTNLLTTNSEVVFNNLNSVLINLYHLMTDIIKVDDREKLIDSLVYTEDNEIEVTTLWRWEDYEYKTFHFERCRRYALDDPVHKIAIRDYLQEQLNILRSQMDQANYLKLRATLTDETLDNMSEYVLIH